MKIILSEDERHRALIVRGALEGGLIGIGVAFPIFHLLNKRSNSYRSLPFTTKLLSGVMVVTPLVCTQAENRSLVYDRERWTELGKTRSERHEHEERERWATLGRKDKVAEWATNHQLSVVMGSWATTMAVAGSIIMRDPLLTMPQKVVQVRLWAQGLTISVIIAVAALTHAHRAQVMEMKKHGDHSWEHTLEDERLEKAPHKTLG